MTRYALPIAPAVLAVMLVAFHMPMPAFMTDVAHSVAAPVWKTRDTLLATVVATYDSLGSTESLVAENIALHNELSVMRRENFMARIVMTENEKLRTLLGRVHDTDTDIVAAVVNDDLTSPYDSFVIDRGTEDGLEEYMLVRSPEGLVVGSIYRALARTAIVTKFSAPTVETDVIVSGTTTIHATMRGYGGGTMMLRIPRDLPVSIGDTVLLPSFLSSPVGEIVSIESVPQDAYQRIYVSAAVNVSELQYVFVDTGNVWTANTTIVSEPAESTDADEGVQGTNS